MRKGICMTDAEKQYINETAQMNFMKWNEQRDNKCEEYRQCNIKKYLYISDKETVISFYKREKPRFLKIQVERNGYKYIKVKDNDKQKKLYIHRLMAEAFPERVYVYGNARQKELPQNDVHHIIKSKPNEPEQLEVLEPTTHHALFDMSNVSSTITTDSKDIKYMDTVSKIANENTSDQAVVVFTGAGIVNGKETEDLMQAIYADDYLGVNEFVEKAKNKLNEVDGKYKLIIMPENEIDRKLFGQLLNTCGEYEKLVEHVRLLVNASNITSFYTTYNNINFVVHIE